MEQRNKLWRRQKGLCKYKARLIRLATFGGMSIDIDGKRVENPHWFDLAHYPGFHCYRSTGTPCSCWMCRGESYDRKAYKKDTRRTIRETAPDAALWRH